MLETYPAETVAPIDADDAFDTPGSVLAQTRLAAAPAFHAIPPEAPLAMADQNF